MFKDWAHEHDNKLYYLPQGADSTAEMVAKSAAKTAYSVSASQVIVVGETGKMAKAIAKYGIK